MSGQKKSKKTAKKAGRSWITIWLIVSAIVFFGVAGYATYTGVNIVKRVVSTKAGGGLVFSSNYMTTGTLTSIENGVYEDYTDSNPEYTMTVNNFSQGDKSAWYTSSDINYTVRAELFLNERYTAAEATDAGDSSLTGTYKRPSASDLTGKQYGIKFKTDASYSLFDSSHLTIDLPDTYTLSKLSTSTDEFMLLLDKSELLETVPTMWIKVTATPHPEVGGEVEIISGYVGTCMSATGEASWGGAIGDEDYGSTDYDAYNYVITGNGRGTFYFAWDDDKVKPNEFALMNYGSGSSALTPATVTSWTGYDQYGPGGPSSVTGSDTWKCISLTVDSAVLPRYEFQLYKTSGSDYSAVISNYVDFKFIPDESGN